MNSSLEQSSVFMKGIIFLLVIIIIGVAIWYYMNVFKPANASPAKISVTDTLVLVNDSIINANVFETIPSGFYQGILPCKDCEGLQRTIAFSTDGRFKMEELSRGKGTPAKSTEGVWKNETGKFVLYLNSKAISKYKLVKDSLINIETSGIRIADSLSRQYVLFKKNTAPENPSWVKRRSEGIDIVGNGNEPSWSIEIDREKLILFRVAMEKPIIVPIEKPKITKDSTIYSIVTETGSVLKVSLSSRFCSDGVGDHLYEHKMTVWYKEKMYKGCGVVLNAVEPD
jgi:uncharacterized membrane protein